MGDTSARNFSLQTILCLTYNFFFYHTVTHIPCSTGIKSLLDGKLSNRLHFLSGYTGIITHAEWWKNLIKVCKSQARCEWLTNFISVP